MAEKTNKAASFRRPKPLHASASFSRMPDAPVSGASPRKRATTLQGSGIPSVPAGRHIDSSPDAAGRLVDVFENHEDDGREHPDPVAPNPALRLPSTFDELPIEIKSLTERFLESLSAKVHPSPLAADALSALFQDFYARASSHIATHIASLASRIGRESTPTVHGDTKSAGKGRPRASSGANRSDSPEGGAGGEMLTASEVADRKKARRLLEVKRLALEEAVERAVCEKVYDRIWQHLSTDDEARDEKLRSRAAALALVGIGLKELHADSDPTKEHVRRTAEEREDEIHQALAEAREALQRMNAEHYPLGKLQHLTATHKSIVETLSQIFPSSSSADEILPTLIYTLITLPAQGADVVSNLNFIQRFRASSKVDGEAAYCLVNLEAAISFLETVDLSSLRADELPEGPPKSASRPATPTVDKAPPMQHVSPKPVHSGSSPVSTTSADTNSSPNGSTKPVPSNRSLNTLAAPPVHHRRLSSLMQQQADRIEAGREGFLSAADKFYDSVNGTLENSLQFVFGRFKEQVAEGGESAIPKTLEDARKLVSSPAAVDEEESVTMSGRSTPALPEDPLNSSGRGRADAKMLELLGGRKALRDRSVDSARSGGSGKRVAFASGDASNPKPASDGTPSPAPTTPAPTLFASINPLNHFPTFARFARSGAAASPAQPSPTIEKPNRLDNIVEAPAADKSSEDAPSSSNGIPFPAPETQRTTASSASTRDHSANPTAAGVVDDDDDNLNAKEALAALRTVRPPRRRFLEVPGAHELRLGEVDDLLLEYRRLAKAIADAVAL